MKDKLKSDKKLLTDGEEKYRHWFEDDLTGDFIASPDGAIIECNPAFIKIYGFSNSQEAKDFNISKFNPSDWQELIEYIKTENKIQGYQSWHLRPDNKEIHVVSNMVGIFNNLGKLVRVKGYVFDDTERKKAEDSLKESEKKYRLLFDEDLTGDFIATPDGKILECNPAFSEMYGFSNRKNALKYNISKFNSYDWSNLINRLETEGKIHNHQNWQKTPYGKDIYVVVNVIGVFNDDGKLIQVKGYVFDDTERKIAEDSLKVSEKRYRLLFDEDLTGDFIATPDGKILECNPAFAEIYGFNDCESALEWNISESNPFDWPFLVTRLKKEHKIRGYQSWQRRSDGMRIHVIANLMGIFDHSDELIQVKGYIFDDSERKRTEQELVQSHRQVTEILNSIQDGFVALNHYWQFIYVNKRAAECMNSEPDDLLGENLWNRFPELSGTVYESVFKKVMKEEKQHYFIARGIRHKKLRYRISVYPSPDGISILWTDVK